MQSVMNQLANLCGFNFQATTFPELFIFMFLALCGTSLLASIIKVLFWLTFNTHKLGR